MPAQFLLSVSVFQVEWIQQQVVKRRIKRDYKPAPPLSLSSPAHSNPAQNNIFYNDAKWSSMWYIVSAGRSSVYLITAPHQILDKNVASSQRAPHN